MTRLSTSSFKVQIPSVLALSAALGMLIALPIENLPLSLAVPLHGVRILLALLFVLFLPGFSLQAALFPKRADLDGAARLAFAIGLSFAVFPLIAFMLDKLPWRLGTYPFLFALALFVLTFTVIANYRGGRLTLHDAVAPAPPTVGPLPSRKPEVRGDHRGIRLLMGPVGRRAYAVLGVAFLLSLAAGLFTLIPRSPEEPLTEFYLLGPNRRAEDLASGFRLGDPVHVVVGIGNREGLVSEYRVDVRNGTHHLAQIERIRIEAGQTVELPISFDPSGTGEEIRAEFLLYRNGGSEPYRHLRLWLSVRAAE